MERQPLHLILTMKSTCKKLKITGNANPSNSVFKTVMEQLTNKRKRFNPNQLDLLTSKPVDAIADTKSDIAKINERIEKGEIDGASDEVKKALGYLHTKLGRLYTESSKS